ncbi:MAG: hypothetical protein N2690_05785 [Rhodocyclaceae bacterium]|nr:hypothetical protein [Rhodocyclaceae bacterium]
MTTVVLLHGWGYDASLWDAVRALLPPRLAVCTLDLGYFGPARLKLGAGKTATSVTLAVGHSLGALWWLAQSVLPWQRLLAINGFPRFLASEDFPGVAPRLLARMQQQFERAPAAVLADFHARCGGHAPRGEPDIARLAAGLDALASWDGRAMLAARRAEVFALAGAHDPIVPAALSRSAFERLECVDAPGHLLPITHPALCAAWIERLADA